MYFWENNQDRALLWAKNKQKRGGIKEPAVIGAILNLGYCCDFMDSRFIRLIQLYHKLMVKEYAVLGRKMPRNKNANADPHNDLLLRELDCAAIEFMHATTFKKWKKKLRKEALPKPRFLILHEAFLQKADRPLKGPVFLRKAIFRFALGTSIA